MAGQDVDASSFDGAVEVAVVVLAEGVEHVAAVSSAGRRHSAQTPR